jgi:hypothetical protein
MERLAVEQSSEIKAKKLNVKGQFERLNVVFQDLTHRLDGTYYRHAAGMYKLGADDLLLKGKPLTFPDKRKFTCLLN